MHDIAGKDLAGLPPVSQEPWVPLPSHKWTEPERWVWEQVRTGREANFNQRYGKELDPKDESLWAEEEKERRTLRPDFLRTILLCEPWRGLITHVGVRIFGAFFEGDIDLGQAEVACELWLEQSRFEGGLSGWAARFKFNFSLEGSALAKELHMDRAVITDNLSLRQGRFASARLHGVQVGGQLSMTGAEFSGELAMDGAEINGSLFLGKGRFASANLRGVQVGGLVSMEEAKFSGDLGMDRAVIKGGLFLRRGRFSSTRLLGVQVGGQLTMIGAEVTGTLAMDRAVIKGSLFLSQGRFASAYLIGVSVGGQVGMEEAKFLGEVNLKEAILGSSMYADDIVIKEELTMDSAHIKGDFALRKARLTSAHLFGLRVDGDLSVNHARFSGELGMDASEIGDSFSLRNGRFDSVRLPGVRVGLQIDMSGAGFLGPVNCEGLRAASNFIMLRVRFFDELHLHLCRVGGSLSLAGCHLNKVSLSQAKITSDLVLSHPDQMKSISWYNGSIDLRETSVGSVLDGQEDWPESLRLDGFRYNSVGSLETIKEQNERSRNSQKFTTASDRSASWYVGWLGKQKDFSMDPYQQCAKFLRESGQPDKANEVMYAGMERERRRMDKWSLARAGRNLLKWTIGYGLGYRYFAALIWAILFLGIGAVVCGAAGGGPHGALFCLGFSLDNMLPLIDLRPEHEAMSKALVGSGKFYFLFVQQLVGWVLVVCVAAGLAGVGKFGGRD
ncbi:MAG: hypothetical protein KQH53_18090 [Desulfarculaceae bacterium]|nr:hypothetical protein [Desulfarculaceae bacterium]